MDSDVAVLKLVKNVEKSQSKSELKLAGRKPKTDKNAVVTGWNQRRQLKKMKVRIIEGKKCTSGEYIYNEDDITVS